MPSILRLLRLLDALLALALQCVDLILHILGCPRKPDHTPMEVIAKLCLPFWAAINVQRPQ